MAYVNLGQVMYPIGAIYCSTSPTNPGNIFGGGWAQITNAALRGATSVGYTGSDECKLTINQMPSHAHEIWFDPSTNGGVSERPRVHLDKGGLKGYTEAFRGQIVNSSFSRAMPVGGGQHIPMCNAPTIVICGSAKVNSTRGDA